MQQYEKVTMNRKHIIVNNFIGGISWGLGATIGLAIILAILGFVVSKIDLVPVIGNAISNGFDTAIKNNPRFR